MTAPAAFAAPPTVDDARLEAAIRRVCRMSNAEFFKACAATGRPVQADPRIVAAWNRYEGRAS